MAVFLRLCLLFRKAYASYPVLFLGESDVGDVESEVVYLSDGNRTWRLLLCPIPTPLPADMSWSGIATFLGVAWSRRTAGFGLLYLFSTQFPLRYACLVCVEVVWI